MGETRAMLKMSTRHIGATEKQRTNIGFLQENSAFFSWMIMYGADAGTTTEEVMTDDP